MFEGLSYVRRLGFSKIEMNVDYFVVIQGLRIILKGVL
jgi:hypothetical protein